MPNPSPSLDSSNCSGYHSYGGSHGSVRSCELTDSAYDSARCSPRGRPPVYATVYFNVDSEDSSSVRTEYTLLEYDDDKASDERAQNLINESLELVSSL